MFTNVQILTEDDFLVEARVEQDRKIIIAYQNLRKVPFALLEAYGHWAEVLDLSHNCLREVGDVDSAFVLHTLIMDHNLVNENSAFPFMPKLRTLWLNNNLIMQLESFIPHLARACPNLLHLSLMGNRATACAALGQAEEEQMRYRHFVISHFKRLRHLDDRPVSKIERLRCEAKSNSTNFTENIVSCYQDLRSAFGLNIKRKANGVV